MTNPFTKISLFILLAIVLVGCNATKRVPDGQHMLKKHTIYEGDKEVEDKTLYNYLRLQPNTRLLTVPLRLHIYNLARPNIDSILTAQREASTGEFWEDLLSRKQIDAVYNFKKSLNSGLKKTGEPPAIITEARVQKSANELLKYYVNNGFFNATIDYDIKRDSSKLGTIDYKVTPRKAYFFDSVTPIIESRVADSIYKKHQDETFIKPGNPYQTAAVNAEIRRLTNLYRNNGLFHFEADRIQIVADTVDTNHKANLEFIIDNRKVTNDDSIAGIPYKVHKISKVNIFTDYTYANRGKPLNDTMQSKGFNFYAYDKINYRIKALTDIIPIEPGQIYSDQSRTQTLSRLSSLRTFKYPNLQYVEDPDDPTATNLIANIRLTPLDKYKLRLDFDASTSNIQDFGIAGFGSLLIRNLFRGAETLEISARGSIGASDDAANDDDSFFNITEIGGDLKLTFPRIFFPLNTSKIIPADWRPTTNFNVGLSVQENIGLDKQNLISALSYNWFPRRTRNYRFDLIDAQYVRNLNVANYFNIYTNSYDDLNSIAVSNIANVNPDYFTTDENGNNPRLTISEGRPEQFINDVQNGAVNGLSSNERSEVNAIGERRERLTEDNLILATNFTFTYNNRSDLYDDTFARFRTRLELAGNVLDLASDIAGVEENENGNRDLFGVQFSQYVKGEVDYTKHWSIGIDNILAIRAFAGLAIPYGNSESIPFTRSFFGGGSNDNRAWQAYQLGPGRSGGPNEFNEANMKLAFNVENRFTIVGAIKGALFIDAGNIWNVFDNVEDPGAVFSGINSLGDIGIGSGFGVRYDFDFFVLRFDIGFKTFNPALPSGSRWFKEYNFNNAVYNLGINYPF